MIPNGFGDPITSFENPQGHADRDTPYLTHTPSSFGGSSSRGAFTFASHDDSFLRAEHRVLFIHFSHQAAIRSFSIPLLFHPSVVGVFAATIAMHTFEGIYPSFHSHGLGFGRKLPHILIGQQLEAFLEIHDERHCPTLDSASTWLSTSNRGAFTFVSRGHCVSTTTTHFFGTMEKRPLFLYLFSVYADLAPRPRARPRPRPRPRRGGRGGRGPDVRVDVRRTEGRPPSS